MFDIRIKKMTADDESVYTKDMVSFNDSAWAVGLFKDFIDDRNAYFLKACICDEVAGYCSVYHNTINPQHFLKIMDLRVKPEFRRKGVARTLMLAALDLAKKLGLDRSKLEVETNNDALKLYESLGYKTVDTESNFYDNGAAAFIMWRYDRN